VKFLEAHWVAQKLGEIVTGYGTVVGHHSGLHRYTVGQRKGLGVVWKYPLHVQFFDTEKNQVVVGERGELEASTLPAVRATWSIALTATEFRTACRI